MTNEELKAIETAACSMHVSDEGRAAIFKLLAERERLRNLPILYFGALMAMRAMNSKDDDPISAFERLKNECKNLISYGDDY